MKSEFLMAKTLLSSYRFLERMTSLIDKTILNNGLNMSSQLYNNSYSLLQEIIDLSERKVDLINLKIIIEDSLSEMDKQESQILIEKFLDEKKEKDIALANQISLRTVSRKVVAGLNSFNGKLTAKGLNYNKFKKLLEQETWIASVYQKIAEDGVNKLSMETLFPKHLK